MTCYGKALPTQLAPVSQAQSFRLPLPIVPNGVGFNIIFYHEGVGRDRGVGMATGRTVRGSNPGDSDIFRTRPDRPWSPAAGAWR
jgi:hypothetical protein